MKKSKEIKRVFSLMMSFISILVFSSFNASASKMAADSDNTYLLQTGMPVKIVKEMDNNFKTYIVNDLKALDKQFLRAKKSSYQFDFIQTENIPQFTTLSSETLTGINLTAYAFRNGSQINIYPTYEFTQKKRPRGKDAFSFQLGDAMRPYDYGGQVWYMDPPVNKWQLGSSMVANTQNLNGAVYSGTQLGSPNWEMKMKGCAWVHADIGSGTDKRIAMGYAYNPKKINVSVSLSSGGSVGVSFSSGSGTVYTAAKTIRLSY